MFISCSPFVVSQFKGRELTYMLYVADDPIIQKKGDKNLG